MGDEAAGKPPVVAVTLNWNQKDVTLECVRSLLGMDYPLAGVIVADNASADGSVEAIRAAYPQVTVIENGQNAGYARGFNPAVRRALETGARYILVVNNDAVLDRDALGALVEAMESDPQVGIASGKVYSYHEPAVLESAGKATDFLGDPRVCVGTGETDTGQHDVAGELEFLDDVYWLVRSDVFRQVGLYSPEFFIYYEEADLCARARRAGYKLLYTPRAKAWHRRAHSSGGGPRYNPFVAYHSTRNRLVFMRRNYTLPQFARFLLLYLALRLPVQVGYALVRGKLRFTRSIINGTIAGLWWCLRN